MIDKKEEHFKLVPATHLILIKEGKILLSRRFNTGYEDGKYSLVAGHLDGDETFLQAMIREAEEEAGISIEVNDLEVIHVMHRKCAAMERIDFFITAKRWVGELRIMEQHKCDDLRWFKLNNLPKNIVPYVEYAIDCIKHNNIYSEFGW